MGRVVVYPYLHQGADGKGIPKPRYPHAAAQWTGDPITPREKDMLRLMNDITDEDAWDHRVFDEEAVHKWRQDALAASAVYPNGEAVLSKAAFEWCKSELRRKAAIFKKYNYVSVLDTNSAVTKSDYVIAPELRQELKAACKSLIDASFPAEDYRHRSVKDYRPMEQTVSHIDPSMYPLFYGQTRTLSPSRIVHRNELLCYGMNDTAVAVHAGHNPWREFSWSNFYQWLPSEVDISKNGDAEIVSYINNLHPGDHSKLYTVIEKFISRSVPLWESCLRTDDCMSHVRITPTEKAFQPTEMEYWREHVFNGSREEEEQVTSGMTPPLGTIDALAWINMRTTHHPEPPRFEEGTKPWRKTSEELDEGLAGKRIQVIVKLASVRLTPENPSYEGDNWHIEGLLNERIAATALYCLDSQNVSESSITFRRKVGFMNLRCLDEVASFDEVYGTNLADMGDPICATGPQELGRVRIPEGRLVSFPNNLQHRTNPFTLVDTTKPGHRTVLILYLIDPAIRIWSTGNVPPQQKSWWEREVLNSCKTLANLPLEISQLIFDYVETPPISFREALGIRKYVVSQRRRADELLNKHLENPR